jgi:hypothetical protein
VFEQFLGIPAHPLIVHAAVVFVPLLALGTVVYAVLPGLRRHIRWAVIALAFVGPGAATLAKLSGDAFKQRLIGRGISGDILTKISQHQAYGDRTMWVTIALGVVALALALVAPGHSAVAVAVATRDADVADDAGATKQPRRDGGFWLRAMLAVLAVAAALVAGYYVFKTGDSGAHIVWSGS